MNKEFKWACTVLLQLNNVPAGPGYLKAFTNPSANQQWINACLKNAQPQIGSMTSGVYDKMIRILQENGIDTNIYGPGNGTGNH